MIYTEDHIDESYQKRIDYAKRYIQQNPSKHTAYVRKWISKNREKVNQQQREYYHANKERLGQKVVCQVCGGTYTKFSKSIHLKTMKHNRCVQLKNLENSAEDTLYNEVPGHGHMIHINNIP